MLEFIAHAITVLLSFCGLVSMKGISLNNQPGKTRLLLTDLNPNKHDQGLHHYPFMVSLDRCNGSLDDLSSRLCVTNKTEDKNLNVFNIITGINESKTLVKHI